ncbi:ABC transporter substrate-binding protein [Clostridium sp. UBA7503]|uniref:ABC transporter substrate-binding protein n=1 Tax=Clostridium sp. UBA7503 TaxID=1946377 RepID=UPI0032167173
MKKRKLMALMLSSILAFSLVGCGDKEKKEDTSKDKPKTEEAEKKIGGTLVAGITEVSGNFNPGYYSSAYDANVVEMVFDQLIVMDVNGEYQPSAAESWEFSDDAKEITFKLKKDMTFSDGEKVTADDVVFSYQFLSDKSYTGRYGSVVKDLVGYKEYSKGKTEEFKGVVAVDEYTVKFSFTEPLRTNLANCTMSIMPEHYYGANWKVGDTSSIESITTKPIGSGPYTLEKFQEKEFVSLKRNPNYYGEGYYIENIVCKFVDQTTDIVELTSQEVDLLPGVIEPEKINEAKSKDFMTFNSYDRSGYGYTKFNCESGPTADKKVRQALYYGFNIKEFVDSYYKDEATGDVLASVQYHPFSQVSWGIDDKLVSEMTEYNFDLDKAKSLLDEAGWKVGSSGYREKDGKVMELNVAAMPDHDILNTLIPMWQRDWGEGLKIKLNIAYLEFNTLLDYVIYNSDENVDKWSIYFMATSINTPDPDSLYSEVHSDYIGTGKDNTARYSNPEVDKLLDEAKSIIDKEEAKPYYNKIAKILNEDAPIVPVYANTYFDMYNKKIKGLETSPFCDWVKALRHAYIEE